MIRVVAGVLEDRGRMLICQRRRDAALGGKWEFPGGKILPSETPRAALARELREELGIEARIGEQIWRMRHWYLGAAQPVEVRFLRAQVSRGVPRNLAFARILWARRQDLRRYDFLAGDRTLVARLARGEI